MKCPNCGNEINDASKFCKECGTRIEVVSKPEITQSIEQEGMHSDLSSGTQVVRKSNKTKIIIIIIAAAVIAGVLIGFFAIGGSDDSDIPAGSYYYEEEDLLLEVDGNSAVITQDDYGYMGVIDSESKTINWKDDNINPATYEIMNGKLYITIEGETAAFEKMDKEELREHTKYKYKGTGESMALGEYKVGTDIKPGSYSLLYYAYDENFESSDDLIGTVTINNGDAIEFTDMDEKKIVLNDGDKLVLGSDGSESEFYLYSE